MIFICLTGQDKTLNLRYKQIIIIPHPDFRPTTTWVHYTSNCKTQPSALEDGQIIARNMLSWLKLLIKLLLLHLVGYRYYLMQLQYKRSVWSLQTSTVQRHVMKPDK